ncbi:MAG: cation:proton antiporter [Actinobacteria bacterium]|nr:cation:proton antiporter [Actinomycetota bacterium]
MIIILLAITIAPIIARYTHIPVIVIELIIGIIMGKSLLNIIPSNALFDFFSSFGLIFIMFLAGLEMDFSKIRKSITKTTVIALFSLAVPFFSGFYIAPYLGIHPLILGSVICTTSLGLILPISRELEHHKEFATVLFGSVILIDILSIFILSFSIIFIRGNFNFTFYYSVILLLVLFILPIVINRSNVKKRISDWIEEKSRFAIMVRFSFALMVILAAISEELGFHSIVGAFIAGLIISEITPKACQLEAKLESFGYGFFIPFFFILVGSKIDIPILFSSLANIRVLLIILTIALLSKFISVTLVTRVLQFNWKESLSMGFLHTARLSLIIAVAEIGRELSLVDENLFSSFMIVAMVSAIVGPVAGKYLLKEKPMKITEKDIIK